MPKETLRILCFGDSLTSGYYYMGSCYHPYSEKLEERLTAAFPDLDIQITENGVPGDIACAGPFLTRLNSQCTTIVLSTPRLFRTPPSSILPPCWMSWLMWWGCVNSKPAMV